MFEVMLAVVEVPVVVYSLSSLVLVPFLSGDRAALPALEVLRVGCVIVWGCGGGGGG